jgi:hypothetical protein
MANKKYEEIAEELSELGYECDAALVEKVIEYHRSNPLPNDAALFGNIIGAAQERKIKIEA